MAGAYINLERVWTVGDTWYETHDLTLDVVIDADGALHFKDEDELAWAEHNRSIRRPRAAHIRDVGDRAADHFRAGGWPLHADWDRWYWPSTSGLPELPDDWDREISP